MIWLVLFLLAVDVEVGGKVRTFSSVAVQDMPAFGFEAGDFLLTRGDLKLKVEGSVGENISFFTRTDVMWFDRTRVSLLQDLEGVSWRNIIPFEVVPYYAWVEGSFGVFDVWIGKREVKWGYADITPFAVFSPPDLANFVAFDPDYAGKGVPVPSGAVVLNIPFETDWFSEPTLEFVWMFSFKPAPLPEGFSSYFELQTRGRSFAVLSDVMQSFLKTFPSLITNFGLPSTYPVSGNVSVGDVSHSVSTPLFDLSHSPFGLKFASTIFGVDLFFGWARTYFPFPIPVEFRMSGNLDWQVQAGQPASANLQGNVFTRFVYPRLDVFGGGFSFELFGFGVRGDVAYFVPEKLNFRTQGDVKISGEVFPESPSPFVVEDERKFSSELQLFENYFKLAFGIDREFPVLDGLYFNFQYSRGFFDEIGFSDVARKTLGIRKNTFITVVQDYFLLTLSQEFAREDVKVELVGVLNVADWKDFTWSLLLLPSVTFKGDGFEILLGYVRAEGDEDAKFGVFRDYSIFLLNFSVIF